MRNENERFCICIISLFDICVLWIFSNYEVEQLKSSLKTECFSWLFRIFESVCCDNKNISFSLVLSQALLWRTCKKQLVPSHQCQHHPQRSTFVFITPVVKEMSTISEWRFQPLIYFLKDNPSIRSILVYSIQTWEEVWNPLLMSFNQRKYFYRLSAYSSRCSDIQMIYLI